MSASVKTGSGAVAFVMACLALAGCADPAGSSGAVGLWIEARPGDELLRKSYEVAADQATAFGVLKFASETDGFAVTWDEQGGYTLVTDIMQVEEPAGCFWYFHIDGKEIMQSSDQAVVSPGSEVHWFLSCR